MSALPWSKSKTRIWSFHKWIWPPFPICHLRWSRIRGATYLHNFQILYPCPCSFSCSSLNNLFLWKYFYKKPIFHHSLESESSLHTIFVSNAIFINSGSFMANPPSALGNIIVLQLTRWKWGSLYFPPCRKSFLISPINCWIMLFGAKSPNPNVEDWEEEMQKMKKHILSWGAQ